MKKITVVLMLLFFVSKTNAQCAMCKAVVENGGLDMAEGINSGITYLMIFPYLLVALLGYVMFRYKKRLKN